MEIVDYGMYVNEAWASAHMSFETRTSDVLWRMNQNNDDILPCICSLFYC